MLALDAAAGFEELTRLASDADDPLTGPAASLRAQLLEAHPAFGRTEAQPFPA